MQERAGIVYLTAEEMRKMDDITVLEFHVDVLMLMENAGQATATLAKRILGGTTFGKRVACLAGGGNNGGDALVAARHLANWGAKVNVISGTPREKVKDAPLRQLRVLEKMGVPIISEEYDLRNYDLLIDGIFGYGLEGNPRDKMAIMIRDANASRRPILALDLPSGMNATTGKAYDPCIEATATLTLALPKTGFLSPNAKSRLGDLFLADISIPRMVYHMFGQKDWLFDKESIVKI
jgi:NAD(P)H-hydrate epimerase